MGVALTHRKSRQD